MKQNEDFFLSLVKIQIYTAPLYTQTHPYTHEHTNAYTKIFFLNNNK